MVFYIRLVFFIFTVSNFYFIYSKKILLTGGAGFIGSHVAQALLRRGDTVIIVDNFNDAYDISIKKHNIRMIEECDVNNQLKVYPVDICDREKMTNIFQVEEPDLICHLAARAGVRTSMQNPYEYFRSNSTGTLTIFELAYNFGIKHVVCASSSSVYGARHYGAFSETDSVDKQSSAYGVTKRSGELLAYVYHHLYGLSITNLRFFSVYGPRGRMDMAPFIFMDAIYHDQTITVYGDGSMIRDFTFIEDIVDGIIKALDNPLGYQILNIGRGEPIILADFINIMENIVGKRANIQYVASFASDVPLTHANIIQAQELIGYNPKTSVTVGLKKMYDWYKSEFIPLALHKKRKKISTSNLDIYFIE
jgi:UDP-glucuronate 4-epimerase